MKISALEEYGLRCMVLLAEADPDESLTIPDISARENMSESYVGKLLMLLRKADLVVAERGRNGGYTLAKPASEIQLSEIMLAFGDPIYGEHHCERFHSDESPCVHHDSCKMKRLWATLNKHTFDLLRNVSLDQFLNGEKLTVKHAT